MTSGARTSCRGLPSTFTCDGTGTIVSPCDPRVTASTCDGLVPRRSATKCLKRAVSSMPAWPITLRFGKPETWAHRAVISSSGLDTTMITASGEPATSFLVTSPTILALTSIRSMRLMPGLRGRPAVMTHTSEPAVSS